jgi:hypothetical protein
MSIISKSAMTVTVSVSTFENGRIDQSSTRAAFEKQLETLCAQRSDQDYMIGNAISRVLDGLQEEGARRVTKGTLVYMVLQEMSFPASDHAKMAMVVRDYIKVRSGKRGEAEFHSGMGKTAFCARWCDIPLTEA